MNTLTNINCSQNSADSSVASNKDQIILACKLLESDIIYAQRGLDENRTRKEMKKVAYDLAEESLKDSIKFDMIKLSPVISIADKVQREARMPFYMKYIFLKWYFWLPVAFLYAIGFVFKYLINGLWDYNLV